MNESTIDFKEHYGDQYPVPYIISWSNHVPVFTDMDNDRVRECNARNLCSVCGQFMNVKKAMAYIGGPHSREDIEGGALWFADPPMHVACAEFSMEHCPHLQNPVVREDTPTGTVPDQGEYVIYICRGRILNKNGFHTRPHRLIRVLKAGEHMADYAV